MTQMPIPRICPVCNGKYGEKDIACPYCGCSFIFKEADDIAVRIRSQLENKIRMVKTLRMKNYPPKEIQRILDSIKQT